MKERILIISDIAPTPNYTAGIILERVLQNFDKKFLIKFFVIHDRSLGNYTISKFLGDNEVFWTTKPREDWSLIKKLPRIFLHFGEKKANRDARTITKDIKTQISREKPDHLVIVIQGQTTIQVAEELLELNIPTTYFHWDLWDWWSESHGLSYKLDRVTRSRIDRLAKEGFHFVPTDNYAKYYEIANENYLTLYPSLVDHISTGPQNSDREINIAFAGQGYAEREIKRFIESLDSINWLLSEKRVVLNVFGKMQITSNNPNALIQNRGWFNYFDLPTEMTFCDLAFLPYPSGATLEKVANTSFPSKLCSYSGANLPVLYLGPTVTPASELTSLIGISLNSDSSTKQIVGGLQVLIESNEKFRQNNIEVFRKYFSRASFHETLNVWALKCGFGELNKELTHVRSVGLLKFVENQEKFQDLDYQHSNEYFQLLVLLGNPKILMIKVAGLIRRKLRKLLN